MGYSGESFDPEKVDVIFKSIGGELTVLKGGVLAGFQESETLKVFGVDEIYIIASLNEGNASGRAYIEDRKSVV